jgi:hypothetical protein
MGGYYPESYLRKRQRDTQARRVLMLVIGLLLLAAVGTPLAWFVKHQLANAAGGREIATPLLAEEKQELERDRKISAATDQDWALQAGALQGTVPVKAPALSEIDYTPSASGLSVRLEGVSSADAGVLGAQVDPALAPEPDAALAGGADEAGGAETGRQPVQDPPAAAAAKPAADDDKKAGQADKDVKKSEPQKTAPKDSTKQESAAKNKYTPSDKDKQDKPAADEDAKVETQPGNEAEFKVYAGSYQTAEAAAEAKKSLSAIGLTGSVISDEAGHRLYVTKVSELRSANALVEKLRESGFGSAYITHRRKASK